jgi:Cu(I)/Ag(I) efflux system membrane fusion protein
MLRAAEAARLAEARLEAGRQLYELEGISRLELDVREQEAFTARLELETGCAELIDHGLDPDVVERLLATRSTDPHLLVRAPVSGVVLELGAQEHEWVQEYAPLVVLGDPRRVELELQIPPDEVDVVQVGAAVDFVPVGRPEAVGQATVVTQVPQVDPETRTVRVRARIDETTRPPVPGVFVEGTLTHGEVRRSPSVPESAVIRLGGGDVVFVRRDASTFVVREVSLGQFNGSRYEVVAGVDLGEEVAVQGVFLLKSTLVGGGGEED